MEHSQTHLTGACGLCSLSNCFRFVSLLVNYYKVMLGNALVHLKNCCLGLKISNSGLICISK